MTIRHRFSLHGLAATLCCCLLLLGGCSTPEENSSGQIEAARGDWLAINYWAEWCKPCIKEVPELNALHARDGVTVLGVNFDGEVGDTLAAQIEKLAIAFPTLPEDPSTGLGVERPAVLPTTLVINPSGELVKTLVGPQTLETLLAATVERPAD
ncbi:MAG: TlpA family protein disulfide reductase [Chromatocurvus sp.]